MTTKEYISEVLRLTQKGDIRWSIQPDEGGDLVHGATMGAYFQIDVDERKMVVKPFNGEDKLDVILSSSDFDTIYRYAHVPPWVEDVFKEDEPSDNVTEMRRDH